MRKVFISTIKLNEDRGGDFELRSRDFDLDGKQYVAPIAYLLDANVEAGDDVLVISGLTPTEAPQKNYKRLKGEMEKILSAHNASGNFITIDEPDKQERELMDSLTFSRFFKDVSEHLQDGDRAYVDVTFGMKSYTLGLYIALEYAAKACRDFDVERMIYAEAYAGRSLPQGETKPFSDIIDITSLFYISTIVNNAQPGQKKSVDNFLKFVVG